MKSIKPVTPVAFVLNTDKYQANKEKVYRYLDELGYPETLSDAMYASAIVDTLHRDYCISCEAIASMKTSLGRTAFTAPSNINSVLKEYARYDLKASNIIQFIASNQRLRMGLAKVEVVPMRSSMRLIVK